MDKEDKMDDVDQSREFGAMGELLRALQKEELEQTEIPLVENNPEAKITQNTTELMIEISSTLKEIAETQKNILKEIKKNKTK
ncbi:MAG: hypothetical protein PHY07_03695 [Methanosarcina sp.]|nr:hypothetical protein [Methanosarcina sp.]